MSDDLPGDIHGDTRHSWRRYLDCLLPFRGDLYAYCRRLTGNLWDAEDLAQETLLRGFGTLGSVHRPIANPRGYLVRIATNLWIDTVRRRELEAALADHTADPAESVSPTRGPELRDASAALLHQLAPQERDAMVLKEVFDMSLEEIARMLTTTVGAVKAALHRGRARLREPGEAPPARRVPSTALVDRFVDRLNAADLPALLALMLDTASIEMFGVDIEVGRDEFEREKSWLWQAVHVHPDLPAEVRPEKFVNERAVFAGEAIMVSFTTRDGRKLLESVTRFEEEDGRIARILAYNFCPDTVGEVGAALGLAVGFVPYCIPSALQL